MLALGLFTADAIHLATAMHLRVGQFVVDDHDLLAPPVLGNAAAAGVHVLNLPDLIAALNAGGAPGTLTP